MNSGRNCESRARLFASVSNEVTMAMQGARHLFGALELADVGSLGRCGARDRAFWCLAWGLAPM